MKIPVINVRMRSILKKISMEIIKKAAPLKSTATLFYLCIYIKIYGTQAVTNFRVTNHHLCLSPDSVLYTIIRVSVQQCVEECASLSECSAVNYKRLFKLCEFHSNHHQNSTFLSNGPCLYVKREDIHDAKASPNSCQNGEGQESNRCRTKFCPALAMKNGILRGNMKTIGSRVEIECPIGLSHKNHTICQGNGSWTDNPKCSGFQYVGCYEDKPERILSGKRFGSSSMTLEMCFMGCLQNNFKYALTEYSQECYCGNTLRDNSKRPEQECNMPCRGDLTQICGSAWRASLYRYVFYKK